MSWYKNLKIGKKFFIAFLLMIAFLVVVGYLGIGSTGQIQGNLEETSIVRLRLNSLIQADHNLQQSLVAERSMIFANARSELFNQLVKDYEDGLNHAGEVWEKYNELAAAAKEKEIIPKFEKAKAEWEAVSKQIVDGRKADTREGRRLAIDLSLGTAKEKFETMRNYLGQLQEINEKIANDSYENAKAVYKSLLITILALTFVAILAALFTWLFMNKTITRPIKALVTRSRDLAEGEGDLTKRILSESKDELGELSGWFNQFIERIQSLIAKAKDSSVELNQSTDKISVGSETLAVRTNEQAASITQTSTTLEEFTAIVKQNSSNSGEANQMLESFNAEVKSRKELIDNMTATMEEIYGSSKKIDAIVNVINDISFQTNLLALNAAVEAARAGEAGRGFAVVASEVRNLAQKTAESSKTIQEIVTQNVDSTNKGTDLVKETSEFFDSILTVLEEISGKVQNIAHASQEQSTGVEQINDTISQLESVISQNAALVDEFNGASKRMTDHSNELDQLMKQFKTSETESTRKKEAEIKKNEAEPDNVQIQKPPTKLTQPAQSKKSIVDDFFNSEEEGFEEF